MQNKNIENYKKILKYIDKLQELQPYLKNKEILNLVEEDFQEIKEIQEKLKYMQCLKLAYSNKKITNIKIDKTNNVDVNIINVYRIIEDKLNNWRDIYLQLKGYKNERK